MRIKGNVEFETCNIIKDCNFKAEDFDAIILKDVLVHFPTRRSKLCNWKN